MAVSKDSPHRRRSIAVLNSKPSTLSKGRRRAHSVVPGELSPFAKARRSLVPRKSILKATTNTLQTDDVSESHSHLQSTSQKSQGFDLDDANLTESMEMTTDFQTRLQDNTSRQSFGRRRVSFASHVRIRVIEGVDKNNTDSAQSPENPAPVQAPTENSGQPITDENAYPGASSTSRRRSSARYSMAISEGEDMDLTTIGPTGFLQIGSAIADEEFDEEGYDDDMDVTEVIHGDFIRGRSLSLGARQPLSQIPQSNEHSLHDIHDQSQSDFDESKEYSDAGSDESQPMEFTMPLRKSLRPPVEHDEVWHALRQATHSGNMPIEPEPSSDDSGHLNIIQDDGMQLDDAMQRLMRARDSLAMAQPIQRSIGHEAYTEQRDDTFSSMEDSFGEEANGGDQTVDISKVYGRLSLGGVENGRLSMGYQDSTMDESQIYGAIVQPNQSTPRRSLAPQPQPSPSNIPSPTLPLISAVPVFQPPPAQIISGSPPPTLGMHDKQATVSVPFSFTPKAPTSPSKTKPSTAPASPSKVFSAAFAPPVSRPTPKKAAQIPPTKRPRQADDDDAADFGDGTGRPSPAKRSSFVGNWPLPSGNSTSSPKPKPLSPSKKAPFQVPVTGRPGPAARPSLSLRRPSGYFARRKSLGSGLKPTEDDRTSGSSPQKKVRRGPGRASVGSAAPDLSTPFKGTEPAVPDKGKQKEHDIHECAREGSRQAIAAPSPTRGSPSPASPRPKSPVRTDWPTDSSHTLHEVDISTILNPNAFEDGRDDVDLQTDATEQWREGIETDEFVGDDGPQISIEQFFTMTGIKFMDELTAPRRSTHPSQQHSRQPRNGADIPLSEYVTAMGVDLPQLVLYSRVSKDLQAWVEKSKADFAQAEDEAVKITPELFTEYSRADEEGQAELLHQLQLIRTNTRGLAKSDWYDWKLQWLEGLRLTADKTFKSLESDARVLEGIKAMADDVVPALRQEYQDTMRELEKENAEVNEIEASDQDYLNELKTSIADQNIEIEALQAETIETKAQLTWLLEKLDDIDTQKQEVETAITDAERVLHIQKHSTRAEVFRLKDELEALEDLHMFRVTKVNAGIFEYVYASQFRVSIPCKNFLPIVSRITITRADKARAKFKDDFPRLSDFFVNMAEQQVVHREGRTTRQVVHQLSDFWSSCAQLRSQLKLLTIKYPLEIEISPPSHNGAPTFRATAMLIFPSVKAKAFVSFVFAAETFFYWPMSLHTLSCEVEVCYGPIDRDTILKGVTSRLGQASPEDNYACLLDACIEAQDIYQ